MIDVWPDSMPNRVYDELRLEAEFMYRIHELPNSLKAWMPCRSHLRDQIRTHAGINYDSLLDLQFTITRTIHMDGYRIFCVHFQSRPGILVTGNLYVPDGDGPFPAVLNLHGHFAQGRLAEEVQARGHSLAKNGYVCLSVDVWGSGERSEIHGEFRYHGNALGASLIPFGETLLGAQIADNMRGVDLLCSLPYVDATRIGVTGESGGGNQTMWIGAMDDRLKAVMPVVSVGTFEAYIMRCNCICECLPGGLTFTEEAGVLALIAPRALKICSALQEANPAFMVKEMLRSYKNVRKIWELYDADGLLSYQAFPVTHGYWPEIREAMLGFFDLHLKGIGHGAPRREISFSTLSEEDLMVFKKGTRLNGVVSIEEYARKRAASLTQPDIIPTQLQEYRQQLTDIFHLDYQPLKNAWHTCIKDGWKCITLRSKSGRILPILSRPGNNSNGPIAILAHTEGKKALENSKLLSLATNQSSHVLLFDAWGTGENGDCLGNAQSGMARFHDFTRALLWLGRTLLGEWTADYQLVADFAEKEYDVKNGFLFAGAREMGLAACLAAAMTCKTIAVYTQDMPSTTFWQDGPCGTMEQNTLATIAPGFALWGDIPRLLNLLNTCFKYGRV